MAFKMKKQLITGLAIAGALSTFQVCATNGYFTHGYGTTHKGMAGAGVAVSEELMSAANNPATLVVNGNAVSVGVELFSPERKYSVSNVDTVYPDAFYLQGPGKKSENSIFAIPEFAIGHQLNDRVNLGLLVYANGGMNTEYSAQSAPQGTFYAGTTGVDLKQLFISPVLSYNVSDDTRLGVSPIFVVQQFEAQGVASFALFSQSSTQLSNTGTDTSTGVGIQLGINQNINDMFSWGASYRSSVAMDEFDKYAGLFAEDGGFDLPSSIQIGVAWQVDPSHQLLLDWQKINYSEVHSITNPISNIMSSALGSKAGAGFGWQDMTIYKVGYQWQRTEAQKIRFGVSYGEQPIPSSQVLFNILAPGVQEWHFTTGVSHSVNDHLQINVMAFYSPSKTVTGANYLAPNQALSISMDQTGFGLSAVWSF
jgi:long-chain fatty acid transport protein